MTSDHYLVVVKIRERLAVSKQTKQRFCMKRFNLSILKSSIGMKAQINSQI
jgi:hypothetical protein